jgi:hypothetical protein
MPRVPTEEEVLLARDAANWRGRADALAKAVGEFLRVDAQVGLMPRDREILDRRAVSRVAMQTALIDYLRTA